MKTFRVLGTSGTVDLQGFFPEKIMEIDSSFLKFIDTIGPQYTTGDFDYDVFQTGTDNNNDNDIVKSGMIKNNLDGNRLCAVLAHLGGDSYSILNVSVGEEQIDSIILILGYAVIEGVPLVFYIEHKFKHGIEKIYLHARPLNSWGRDTPMVLVVIIK